MVTHNTPNEKRLKRLYGGEGGALMRDRGIDAQTVFNPDEVDKWLKAGVNKTDLRGFDTTDAKEPSQRQIGSRMRTGQVLGYIESEPDRFVQQGMESFKQLNRYKDEIVGYDSFKKAVEKAWSTHSQGDKGLNHLFKEMTESDFQALFETNIVQGWVRASPQQGEKISHELQNDIITTMMKKYNIERGRATARYNGLAPQARQKLIDRFRLRSEKQAKRRMFAGIPENVPKQTVRYRGRTYTRSKPDRWLPLQETFIRNNRGLPLKDLTDLYRRVFAVPRSYNSIKFKRQRLSRVPGG